MKKHCSIVTSLIISFSLRAMETEPSKASSPKKSPSQWAHTQTLSNSNRATVITALAALGSQKLAAATKGFLLNVELLVWNTVTDSYETLYQGNKYDDTVSALTTLTTKKCAAGQIGGTIRLFDSQTNFQLKPLLGHTEEVTTLAAVNTQTLVSGSKDCTVCTWDLQKSRFKVLFKLPYNINAVVALDSNTFIIGSNEANIRLLDSRAGTTVQQLIGHMGQVNAVIKLDDTIIASGAGPNSCNGPWDTTVRLWDIRTNRTTQTKKFNGSIRTLAALSPSILAVAFGDLTINIWDTQIDTSTTFRNNFEIDAVVALDADTVAYGSCSNIEILQQKQEPKEITNIN